MIGSNTTTAQRLLHLAQHTGIGSSRGCHAPQGFGHFSQGFGYSSNGCCFSGGSWLCRSSGGGKGLLHLTKTRGVRPTASDASPKGRPSSFWQSSGSRVFGFRFRVIVVVAGVAKRFLHLSNIQCGRSSGSHALTKGSIHSGHEARRLWWWLWWLLTCYGFGSASTGANTTSIRNGPSVGHHRVFVVLRVRRIVAVIIFGQKALPIQKLLHVETKDKVEIWVQHEQHPIPNSNKI